jgi:two-component system NtrC family sensor kinase
MDKGMENLRWREILFESLSFPTLILAPDMTIVAANKPFFDKYGYHRKELIGKKCNQILCRYEGPCPVTSCPIPRVLTEKKGAS